MVSMSLIEVLAIRQELKTILILMGTPTNEDATIVGGEITVSKELKMHVAKYGNEVNIIVSVYLPEKRKHRLYLI